MIERDPVGSEDDEVAEQAGVGLEGAAGQVVEGEGIAQIGEEKIEVRGGDFIAFPLNGKAHTIVNTGTGDLVYLTGGEDTPYDIGHFPSVNKMIVFKPEGVELIDQSAGKTYSYHQWIAGELK